MTTRARLKQKAKLKAAASRRMFVSTKSAVRCASQYDVQPPSLVGCKSCSDEARAAQTVPAVTGLPNTSRAASVSHGTLPAGLTVMTEEDTDGF